MSGSTESAMGVSLWNPKRKRKSSKPKQIISDSSAPTKSADTAEAARPDTKRKRLSTLDVIGPSFMDLGLSPWICKAVDALGYKRPTEIQKKSIPEILKGKNVVGRAKTGSGKTASFALPMLHKLAKDPFGIFGLVLTPTRELAFQIAHQFRAFGTSIGLKDCVIIGGVDMVAQGKELEDRPHIVIATPGRLADHISSQHNVNFQHLQFLVLDEADRLFEPCFAPDVRKILSAIPSADQRQTLLYSATITPSLAALQSLVLGNDSSGDLAPVFCDCSSSEFALVEQLNQQYLFVPQSVKECYLIYALKHRTSDSSVIVFTSTCRSCEVVSELLTEMELDNVSLNSYKDQNRRNAALGKFRGGVTNILVATDVASRGLDIPEVGLVINFDVPKFPQDYIHRVGRTARAGRGGLALTLVTQYDIALFKEVESLIKKEMTEYPHCPEKKVLELLKTVSAAKRMAQIHLDDYEAKDPRLQKIKKRKEKAKAERKAEWRSQHKPKQRKPRKADSSKDDSDTD